MATIPESHQDLLSTEFATLATIGTDSHPQISEVWFLAEDGTIRISLNTARQKTKNLLHNPACTLFILDLANPYRYLELRADAEVNPDADYRFADKVGAKYGSELRAHDKANETRVVVTLNVIKANAVDMRA
jgi:PPOX class probable F420-dependent enzyme